MELLDDLQISRPSIDYSDEREVRHSLTGSARTLTDELLVYPQVWPLNSRQVL